MNLFIIGNGFDLGHNLPTRYWDFRVYLEERYPEFLRAFEEHYYIYPNTKIETKKNLLWNELETNLANIDEDIIIENAVSIDMDLEGGDVGIEDTLYQYFSDEYSYVKKLAIYLKQWIRTIRIRDIKKRATCITKENLYITFNYTAVLENVYDINQANIIHIHGSLREYDVDPVLGHGNKKRIENIKEKKEEADRLFDEKWSSICRVVEEYYKDTYKDVSRYSLKLSGLKKESIEAIYVIGHSLAGVDMQYFRIIDVMTNKLLAWNVYYYTEEEQEKLKMNLKEIGISGDRIKMIPSDGFYDI